MAEALTNAEVAWRWYAGDNDERYTIGPHSSREEALTEAYGMGWERIFLCEACKVPVQLSRYFSTEALAEAVFEDGDLNDPDGGHYVEVTTTQDQDHELETLVRAVIDEWQARHKIFIDPWTFTEVRNAEKVEVDLCQVCCKPLAADDICATDIEMGICHAACLEGSHVVDTETGEPFDGPTTKFRYGDITDQKTSNGIRTAVAAALATIALSGCQTLPVKESHPGHEYRPVTVETPCCDIDPPPVNTVSTGGAA